ncbi:hypothetical protein MYX82_02155 [Acidobacteria bacterium AH-259-D05]|nr:hypothetical protein [Acidobacteria bacterium AH-259-D05]
MADDKPKERPANLVRTSKTELTVQSSEIVRRGLTLAHDLFSGPVTIPCLAPIGRFQAHTGAVLGLTFSADSSRIFSGGEDGTISSWALQSDDLTKWDVLEAIENDDAMLCHKRDVEDYTSNLRSICFTRHAEYCLVGIAEEGAYILNPNNREAEHCLSANQIEEEEFYDPFPQIVEFYDGFELTAISPDGSYKATAAEALLDSSIAAGIPIPRTINMIFCLEDWGPITYCVDEYSLGLDQFEAAPTTLEFSPDGKRLFAGRENGVIQMWFPGELLMLGDSAVIQVDDEQPIESLAVAPDRIHLVSCSEGGTSRLWNIGDALEVMELSSDDVFSRLKNTTHKELIRFEKCMNKPTFSPDSRWILYGHGNTVCLWSMESKREICCQEGHEYVTSVAFSGDGRLIASGFYDGTVRLWETRNF